MKRRILQGAALWQAAVNFHAFYKYSAQDRFQGQAFGISLTKKFW